MEKRKEKSEFWEDIIFAIVIIWSCLLFSCLGYYCWYDLAKTEDTLMCVRDCMPYPYN